MSVATYSKKIVDLYYGDRPGLSYFVGCSAGGRQGMKELQDYPEDYDAALIGEGVGSSKKFRDSPMSFR